uniref:YSIRK-type signal peptide-containing protein n=1 Tax=Streptococcus sp. 714 TaxID=2582653 RepID=UPI0015668F23
MFHKGKHNREKQLRFSIRKVSFGAASVAVAALFMFLGNGAVSAAEQGVPSTNGETQAPQPKDQNVQNGTYEGNTVATSPAATVETNTQPSTVENSPSPESAPQKVETLDKKELTDLIKEIDGKFAKGTYATKTEESVNNLRTVLEEARTTLNNAKTPAELTQAQAKLVTATTKLQTKPEEKKEVAAVDTTNGKATVGKKATNTEKSSESNSIANSGSRDERNGKEMDKNNPFRTDTTPSTTDDPSANQTYTLPEDSASVDELANKLKGLDSSIRNETKLASIDEVGRLKSVQPGKIQEIDEFGGWSAITADGNKGKFAIARKTDAGVYPIETVNVTRTGAGENRKYVVHVQENAFDRSNKYALFLSKVRTYETKNEKTFDEQPFKDVDTNGGVGEGPQISRGLKGFNGIEKTYKAYSPSTGTGINISFKTGFTGDIDGVKAGYKVEVIAKFKDGRTESIYNESFLPTDSINNGTKHVVSVDAKDSVKFEVKISSKPSTDDFNQQLAKYKNSQENKTGSFTSKTIDLPKGAIEYTVRISASDNSKLGMGYQTVWSQYALPVTGTGFSIEQDTKNVAKDLLQRIYNKLIEQKSEDTKWSTPETKAAYETKLTEIKNLLSSEISTTSNYKESAKSLIEKYNSLNNRDTIVAAAKAALAQAVEAEKNEINADNSLTSTEKAEKVKAVEAKKTEEEAKIAAAENADKVAEAKTAGEAAVKAVHDNGDLEAVKTAAKA